MSPEEWRDELVHRLDERTPTVATYEAYYDGRHRLAFATTKFREAFGTLFSAFSDNWCGVVVDAAVERLEVQGFRFGRDADADEEAWRIFQANMLDAELPSGFETAVSTGYGSLLVSPDPDDETTPIITVEHPLEMIVATAPGRRRRRLAALKKWVDDEGQAFATLYLPKAVHKWQSKEKVQAAVRRQPAAPEGGAELSLSDDDRGWKPILVNRGALGVAIDWEPRLGDADEDGYSFDNPLGDVPVVPLLNRSTLAGHGRSDLASVVPIQDAVNKLCADMLVASEFAAFRQRWATGIEIPLDPETGQPMRKQFDAAIDRMWSTGNEDAKFGDFNVTELGNYVKGVEMYVQHLAAQTRTPPHYLLGQSGAFPSGESLKSTETGLVARVRRKMTGFGESLEESMRLGFKLVDAEDERAGAIDAETIWRDPESRSEGELVDGLVKLASIGVPRRALWERLGASPQQITRWETMAAEQAIQEAAADNVRVFGPAGQGATTEVTPPPESVAAAS